MTANEKRAAVIAKYKTILGRNIYSQPRRDYCFKKYSDGKYYSDCSSSVSYCYKEAGLGFGIMNTVGMYQSNKFTTVDVTIKKGIPQDVDKLRVGDMLLYAGTDKGRAYAGYVGHVEMIYAIDGDTVTLCGHGSGNPSKKNMVTYCRSRYNSKTTKTPIGNKGLIKIVRYIQDDDNSDIPTTTAPADDREKLTITGNTVNLRYGPSKEYAVKKVARKGNAFPTVDTDGWRAIKHEGRVRWISDKYVDNEGVCSGNSVNIRIGPGTNYKSLGHAHKGNKLELVTAEGWLPIEIDKEVFWVSGKYAK